MTHPLVETAESIRNYVAMKIWSWEAEAQFRRYSKRDLAWMARNWTPASVRAEMELENALEYYLQALDNTLSSSAGPQEIWGSVVQEFELADANSD